MCVSVSRLANVSSRPLSSNSKTSELIPDFFFEKTTRTGNILGHTDKKNITDNSVIQNVLYAKAND